jgi:hypothetical protein
VTIDQRIKKLEDCWAKSFGCSVPGTTFTRVLKTDSNGARQLGDGWEWSLTLGGMQQPWKTEFRGSTILDCIRQAEKAKPGLTKFRRGS